MGRAYNNRPAKARSSASQQFLVIVVTFVLGYLTASVCDVETLSRWVDAQILAHHEVNQAAQQKKPQAQQEAATPPKPKFEFYTLLANDKVPNSQSATTVAKNTGNAVKSSEPATKSAEVAVQAAATNTAVAAATPKTHQAVAVVNKPPISAVPAAAGRGAYSVQVASFKARRDAEHMKGVLTLKGFNANIVPIYHATKGNWFRVIVGPYSNRVLAQNAQVDLVRKSRLRGMVVAG